MATYTNWRGTERVRALGVSASGASRSAMAGDIRTAGVTGGSAEDRGSRERHSLVITKEHYALFRTTASPPSRAFGGVRELKHGHQPPNNLIVKENPEKQSILYECLFLCSNEIEERIVDDDSRSTEDVETDETDRDFVDEEPDRQVSRDRERDHLPDAYTTGYDSFGNTRVGVGSAGGDVTKLVRHNEGRHWSDGKHSAREAARDKKRVTQAFCSVLDVTPHQQREAVVAMGKMNLDRFGQQKRLEKVALVTIKVIVEWDRNRRFRRMDDLSRLDTDALPDKMLNDEGYCDLLNQYDVSRKDVYSVSQLVKRELKRRNYFGTRAVNTPVRAGQDEASASDD